MKPETDARKFLKKYPCSYCNKLHDGAFHKSYCCKGHKIKRARYDKKWRKKNIDKISEREKRYKRSHRKRERVVKRIYYLKHKEEDHERRRKLNLKNPELRKKHYKKWYKKNKNKIKAHNYAFNHRKEIMESLGNCCFCCGATEKLHIHHINYTNNLEDMLLLCLDCHAKQHRKEPYE